MRLLRAIFIQNKQKVCPHKLFRHEHFYIDRKVVQQSLRVLTYACIQQFQSTNGRMSEES